ncbi:hypothetical protein [Leisingera caerulea]|uniref:hypothetical protein n=1 Tax=Leisingera caerulea TaxID=506591 RepID=UPI0003F833A5|nr:hypothetical protein [Leisingera caerulea]
MIRIIALAAAIAIGSAVQFGWAASPAVAVTCFSTFDLMAGALLDQYSELPIAEMLAKNGNTIHLFIAPNDGTWTIVSTEPGGVSCALGYGADFQALGPPGPEHTGELH